MDRVLTDEDFKMIRKLKRKKQEEDEEDEGEGEVDMNDSANWGEV